MFHVHICDLISISKAIEDRQALPVYYDSLEAGGRCRVTSWLQALSRLHPGQRARGPIPS
eukprot:scaffold3572_cov125-Isochrysis_galbana.AAC.1